MQKYEQSFFKTEQGNLPEFSSFASMEFLPYKTKT